MPSTISAGTTTGSAIVVTGDTTGNLAFQTNGTTTAMTITTSQNVGIGTTAPGNKLDVTGATSTYIAVQSTNAGTGSGLFTTNATRTYLIGAGAASGNSNLEFRDVTGSATRMSIDTSGNVGIGTTPSAWATIAPGLDVGSTAAIASFTNQAVFAYNLYYNGSNFVYKTSTLGAAYRLVSGTHYWETAPSGSAGATVVPSLRMVLDNDGNLRLNTASTGGKLSVFSSTGIGLYSSTNGAFAAGYFDTVGANQGVYAQSSGNYGLYARTTNSSFGGILAYDYSLTYYGILAYGGYSLYTNGSIYVNGTTYTSDARLKENVQPISNALDKIKQLNPVSFDWKANSAKGIGNNNKPLPDYGMIAQEVEQILPDLVRETAVPPKPEGTDVKLSLEDELGSCKGIDYSRLIPFLTKAIQELKAELDEAKAEIQALKGAQ